MSASEVEAWLAGLYGPEDVPPFERTPETIAHLHGLMQKHRAQLARETDATADALARSRVYAAEAQRYHQLNEAAGLTESQLSKAGRSSLQTLVGLTDALVCLWWVD
jgi:hypothetical protein